jgi:hypothetical protein
VPDDGAPLTESAGGSGDVSVRELPSFASCSSAPSGGNSTSLRRASTRELTTRGARGEAAAGHRAARARDRQLAIALAPTVENAISESVVATRRRSRRRSSRARPSIRKAIAETMSGLVNTINRAIEHSLSPQGIRWRIESWRTGVPFAQIVMRHALVYRVEQVFLVHAETGCCSRTFRKNRQATPISSPAC